MYVMVKTVKLKGDASNIVMRKYSSYEIHKTSMSHAPMEATQAVIKAQEQDID
jgi:hypothetical protein